MNNKLTNYDYSRKILFMETNESKFKDKLESKSYNDTKLNDVAILDSITRKVFEGKVYDFLQKDDQTLGWIHLKNSPQIYRFPAKQCKILDEQYYDTKINQQLGKIRNYKLLFKDKIVHTKSVVNIEGENYYSIFINNIFHGFHHESYVDLLIDTDISLNQNVSEIPLYKISNLTQPTKSNNKNIKAHLIGVFLSHNIGKVRLKDEQKLVWINLKSLDDKIKITNSNRTINEKILDDIFEFIKVERNKSKLITEKVLGLKEFIKTNLNNSKDI